MQFFFFYIAEESSKFVFLFILIVWKRDTSSIWDERVKLYYFNLANFSFQYWIFKVLLHVLYFRHFKCRSPQKFVVNSFDGKLDEEYHLILLRAIMSEIFCPAHFGKPFRVKYYWKQIKADCGNSVFSSMISLEI